MTEDPYECYRRIEGEIHIEENGPDGVQAWIRKPSDETLEQEQVKGELLARHHEDHFEAPDPSDDLTDDELWEQLPESFRRNG